MIKRLFWPVLAPSLLFATGTGAIIPVLVLGALHLGASDALGAGLVAFSAVAALSATVPVGAFIDRVGDRRAMTVATIGGAAFLFLSAAALAFPGKYSLVIYILSLVLRSPAIVAWNLARQSLVAESVSGEYRGRAMTALGGTMRVGNITGPAVGALLLTVWPIWSVFLFAAIAALSALAIILCQNDQISSPSEAPQKQEFHGGSVNWRAVFFAGIPIFLLAVARVTQSIVISLWGLSLGWEEAQIALAIAVGSTLELLLLIPGGYMKDALGRSETLATCLVVFGTGFLVITSVPNSFGLIIGIALMATGNGFGSGINMTIGADLSPSKGRARFLSIWSMFPQAGMIAGPGSMAALIAFASLPAAVALIGICSCAGALWSMLSRPITRLPGRTRRD